MFSGPVQIRSAVHCACRENVRGLAEKAEGLGVEIYPGFAASEVLHSRGAVAMRPCNNVFLNPAFSVHAVR